MKPHLSIVRWLLAFGLLLLLAVGDPTQAAEQARLVVRTPERAPEVTHDAQTQAWLASRDSIRVGFWGRSHPPMHMGLEPNTFEGVTADTLGLLEQMLGVRLEMLSYSSKAQALQAMRQGDVDMFAVSSVDAPANPLYNPTKPYLLNRAVLVRRVGQAHASMVDLSGERLAYIAHSDEQSRQLKARYPLSNLQPYTYYLNALAGVVNGQADVLYTDAISAEFLISRFYRNAAYIAGDASSPEVASLNFAVSAREPQLLKAIDQSLAAIPPASMVRITSQWGLSSSFVEARPLLQLTPAQTEWVATHRTLKVGINSANAPLTFFDEQNELQGLSADLLKRIGSITGLSFELVRANGISELVEQLQSNKIDLIAGLNVDANLVGQQQLSRIYLVSPYVVLSRRNEAGLRDLEELNGLRLALTVGSSISSWLYQHYPDIHQVSVRNTVQGIDLLLGKEVEGAVSTQFTADYFISQHFQSDLRVTSSLGPVPAKIAMAVAPQHGPLKGIIDAALLSISPEELKDITDRWRNNAAPAVASPWNTYKQDVLRVLLLAGGLMLVFLVWNYYLRVQINKRKQAERGLQDQLQFSRTLIDGAPVALYVRDEQGRLAQCNQAYLDFFGTTREALIGTTLVESQVFDTDFSTRYHQAYLDTLSHGQPAFADLNVQVQGRQVRVHHWILPFRDSTGRYIGVIGGWLDITEREQLIAQLQQANVAATDANRSKSVFLASMSHEIRTPVSALVGLIELLQLKGADTATIDADLEVAHQSAQSLLSLIGDILDLSKIEAGEMTPVQRPTHLAELMQAIHRLFEPNARTKQLDYRLATELQHPGVMIDALMLNQVVANLLSNAIKFTDQGSVHLLLRELPGESPEGRARFAIQVSDTGRGLSEGQSQAIFEPFVQAEPQANRPVGTGLGLSICASLAKLLGAQLTVDSQPGLGSRFTLVFEAQVVEVQPTATPAAFDTFAGPALKILVVEDHAPNRLLLCRQLEYLGHQAWPCDDGEAALALWKTAHPPFDLTITDCGMPLMDGYQLVRAMREDEQLRAVRPHTVFGLTANAQPEIVQACQDAGMSRCLFKPLGMQALHLALTQVQQSSPLRAASGLSELEQIRALSPQAYAPLVEEIVRTHRADGEALQRLALAGEPRALARLVHKVRGGARLTGDQALNDACAALEQLIEAQGDARGYARQVEKIVACLQALEARLLKDLPD
ncbi:transporter substrate-binding domain-containing protein [Pseudomonas sp. BW16M2]|uniref:transporter substrate-binding domain-containing protein n=1 Tax=Pseudomonas sp. BW16M2 TaxID=2745489 RepID=UPI001648DD83|nr:transporter substrate-binding domain-containing protein [Pseudomonas sp. BW16M2]MBC3438209.1 transporter substrate-binding domain-containing protein [Pseudomonas sp. BW16M2]